MREIGVDELFARSCDPFVRHQMDPTGTRRAWVAGDACVVDGTRGRPNEQAAGPVFTCLGPAADLGPLMSRVADTVEPPWRLTVETTSYDDVPPRWRHREHHTWHWMMTRTAPPPPELLVVEVDDAASIDAVLDVANPYSFARPGTTGVECWLGVRLHGSLVGVGALIRQPDGTGHLRGVSVLPDFTGRGVGRAVSAGLTLRALASGSGVATLGVFTDNAPANAVYRRLDFDAAHTFASGALDC